MNTKTLLFLMVWVATLLSCTNVDTQNKNECPRKITFDLAAINDAGLRGPPNGLVSVDYEFCIPDKEIYEQEVKKIDSSVRIMYGSKGRIGCKSDQYLCIGNTHQENFREVLRELAKHKYIDRIDECFWE